MPDGGDRGTLHVSARWIVALDLRRRIRRDALLQCLCAGGADFSECTGPARARAQGSEPPFAIAQDIVLLLFIVAGIKSVKRFHPVIN